MLQRLCSVLVGREDGALGLAREIDAATDRLAPYGETLAVAAVTALDVSRLDETAHALEAGLALRSKAALLEPGRWLAERGLEAAPEQLEQKAFEAPEAAWRVLGAAS